MNSLLDRRAAHHELVLLLEVPGDLLHRRVGASAKNLLDPGPLPLADQRSRAATRAVGGRAPFIASTPNPAPNCGHAEIQLIGDLLLCQLPLRVKRDYALPKIQRVGTTHGDSFEEEPITRWGPSIKEARQPCDRADQVP